ncbi:MAG TPA: hypothetical protein DEQ43_12880 [Nocardioides bacterium]|nr:hypothetical protein [Nocardioides sp.]
MPIGQRKVHSWDAEVTYGEQGPDSAPAVLLLHGEEGPLASKEFAAAMALEHRVVTPFIPGFGGTERLAGADRPHQLAYVLLDLLDALHLERVAIVGTSLGAWLGLEVGVMEPRRLTSLTAVSPVGVKLNRRDERSFAEILVENPHAVRETLYADPELDPWLDDSDPDTKLAKAQTRESFMHYVWEPYLHNPLLPKLLPRLRDLPTLVVDGERDGLAPSGYYDQLAERLQAARRTISRAGHYPDIEQPGATAAAIGTFITEADSADLSARGKELV